MKSMTGFGKALKITENYQIDVEIKSVNHRFLDFQLRMPRQLNAFESQIRQTIKEQLNRGRIEVFITLTEKNDLRKEAVVHWELMEGLVQSIEEQMQERFQTTLPVERLVEGFLENPAFMEIQEKPMNDDSLELLVLEAVREAALANVASRALEGQGIQQVLVDNQRIFVTHLTALADFVAVFEVEYQARFQKKLEEYLGASVDQERILTEMVILLEKSDVHEELDRLTIHLKTFEELLFKKEPVGRELDFLVQEMNREVNTIGSKSTTIEVKHHVVQMKTTLEKIREQIQNIE